MKTKNFVLLLLCIICSCEGGTIDPYKAGITLRLRAEIEGSIPRASNSSWENGDAIGVYMVKAGEPLNTSSLKQNIKYTTSGSSTFNPANESEQILLPFDGSGADLISYYPYREDITTFSYPIDLENQSLQADIDLMYANNVKKINSKNPNAQMQFTHQLSKIVLNIAGSQAINLSDLSVVITNAGTQATFNLATGSLSAASVRGNIPLKVANDGSMAEAILLPEADLPEMELWFIIGEEENEVYKFPLVDSVGISAFEKSTQYTYNVTLFSRTTIAVVESNITAWINEPSASVKANRTNETPPLIKGSKKSPYSVAEAKIHQGKTGVWVKGFIVGSSTGSNMNNFTSDVSLASNTNIVLADTTNETDTDKMIPVELPTGSIRNALNLKENPGNMRKQVIIKGSLERYYSAPGLKNPKEHQIINP